MLIRRAPTASPPRDAMIRHLAPSATIAAPYLVPPTVAKATASAGAAAANDAGDLPAEREATLAADHEADLAFEREIERELKRWADLSAERKAVIAVKRTTDSDESAAVPTTAAIELAVPSTASPRPGRGVKGAAILTELAVPSTASPRPGRGVKGAAILTALALTAAAIVLLMMPDRATGPVSATSEPVLSASHYTGASDRVTEPARAGARPIAAAPVERITPGATAPAQVAGEAAPTAPALDAEALCAEDVAEAAPPAPLVTASEPTSDAEPVPNDRSEEDRAIVPAGEVVDRPASALAVEAEPVAEAAPAAPTSAPLQRKRPPRARAQQRARRDAEALGAQVIPTARDLVDAPADITASGPETPSNEAPPAE